jgi:hypothetical protein
MDNTCEIIFDCKNQKECKYFKPMPRKNKPCTNCKSKSKYCGVDGYICALFQTWLDDKIKCRHNQNTLNKCFNLTAQLENISIYLNKLGFKGEIK